MEEIIEMMNAFEEFEIKAREFIEKMKKNQKEEKESENGKLL